MRKVAFVLATAAIGVIGSVATPKAEAGSPFGIHYRSGGLHVDVGHVHHRGPHYQRQVYRHPHSIYYGRYPVRAYPPVYRGHVHNVQRFYPYGYGYSSRYYYGGRSGYCPY